MGNNISLHILKASQMEHDKVWKDLSYVYGPDHACVKSIQEERNSLTTRINILMKHGK